MSNHTQMGAECKYRWGLLYQPPYRPYRPSFPHTRLRSMAWGTGIAYLL
jgi:hypothetical protein